MQLFGDKLTNTFEMNSLSSFLIVAIGLIILVYLVSLLSYVNPQTLYMLNNPFFKVLIAALVIWLLYYNPGWAILVAVAAAIFYTKINRLVGY